MSKSEKTVKTVKKTYTYFDLNTGKKVSVEKEIPPFVKLSTEEALSLIANDNELLTKAVNAYQKRAGLKSVKMEVAALGGDTSVVMSLAKPFRAMPPFNQIFERNSDGTVKTDKDGKVIDRPAQTEAILTFIWSNPSLVESIKQASIEAAGSDDEDDEKEGETE